MAWSARLAAQSFGPEPRQTIGAMYTCDSETKAVLQFAGAQRNLTNAQLSTVSAAGYIAVFGGGHAEEKLVRSAFGERLAIGTSNNFCGGCQGVLTSSGAIILPPFGNDRGSKGAYWPAAE